MQAENANQAPSMEACTGIQDDTFLPKEILGLIFEYLSLVDRKAVRLTCKVWSNASKSISITKNEKLVLRPHYRNIMRTLTASNVTQFNLQFQGRRIDKIPISLWRKCGSRIRSLEFYSCRLSPEVLANIILRCNNLKSLSLINNLGGGARSNFDALIRILNDFIEQGVMHTQVNALRIEDTALVSVPVTDVLKKAILVFPHIKSFKVYSSCGKESQIGEEVSLNSVSQLGSFAYDILYLKYFFVLDEPIRIFPSNLMEFEVKIQQSMDCTHTGETLLKFFSTQENLRVVKLDVERGATLLKKLVFFLLENCKNLCELIIACGSTVKLSSTEADKLLDSITTLQRLDFECSLSLPSTWMSSPRNLALSRLFFLASHCNSTVFFSVLLKGCQKVEFLFCDSPCNNILEAIFENLTNLRSLTLHWCYLESKFGFLDPSGIYEHHYSIHRLKNLESLTIIYGSQIDYLPTSELKFPLLKHLNISALPLDESFDELCQVVWSMPMFQSLVLHFDSYNGDMDDVIELCRPMKHLQCLYFEMADVHKYELHSLFNEYCPSLRYVITKEEVFLFNPFGSKITKCSKDKFDDPMFVK